MKVIMVNATLSAWLGDCYVTGLSESSKSCVFEGHYVYASVVLDFANTFSFLVKVRT